MLSNTFRRATGRDYTSLGEANPNLTIKRQRRAFFSKKILLRFLSVVFAIFIFYCIGSYLNKLGSRSNSDLLADTDSILDTRLVSKHCDNAATGKPLVQYVLMIDAGSTGSRIHVYKFNNCKNRPELEDEVFEQIKPGLSSFGSDAEGAAKSLDVLMDIALKNIPPSLRSCTPVSVKATAGLRLLGNNKAEQILKAIRNRFISKYPFQLAKENAPISVMEGRDEGVFAWITVNYLLNTIGNTGSKTAGTFDLGGGSAQIVFEPSSKSNPGITAFPETNKVNDYKHKFNYNKLNYELYQHSYLGYGLMSAREKMLNEIVNSSLLDEDFSAAHPCFPPHYEKTVNLISHSKPVKLKGLPLINENQEKSTISSSKTSGFEQCLKVAQKILNVSETCTVEPCSFSGIYQPDFNNNFDSNPFYIFSYFYDRTDPFKLGSEFKLSDIKKLAEKVCHHDYSMFKDADELKELKSESHYCLDLSYIYSLLKYGIGVSDERVLKTARKINDAETGWCLGAALSLLSQHSYCPAY
ncbi:hypothetical protein BB561_005963 [Smittium simulii]|uniref:guanosine-diphosphatase n=1 Tax=Smittium simulii TaxID=133385 RepID=A0A2T9Y7C4_9FUNG|nr:hypothetical protein BB561_005963 [Smittium simulii]